MIRLEFVNRQYYPTEALPAWRIAEFAASGNLVLLIRITTPCGYQGCFGSRSPALSPLRRGQYTNRGIGESLRRRRGCVPRKQTRDSYHSLKGSDGLRSKPHRKRSSVATKDTPSAAETKANEGPPTGITATGSVPYRGRFRHFRETKDHHDHRTEPPCRRHASYRTLRRSHSSRC